MFHLIYSLFHCHCLTFIIQETKVGVYLIHLISCQNIPTCDHPELVIWNKPVQQLPEVFAGFQ